MPKVKHKLKTYLLYFLRVVQVERPYGIQCYLKPSFVIDLSGTCASQSGSLSWHISDDRSLLCYVTSTDKTLMSVADLMCEVTRRRGITEISIVDHSMTTMKKAMIKRKMHVGECFSTMLGSFNLKIHYHGPFPVAGHAGWLANSSILPLQGGGKQHSEFLQGEGTGCQ